MTKEKAILELKTEIEKLFGMPVMDESACLTCVQDCQFIGCDMPYIRACTGYLKANDC